MADPDDEAIATLARNAGKTKCHGCNGTGKVLKYVRPHVTDLVDLVDCLRCKGSGNMKTFAERERDIKEFIEASPHLKALQGDTGDWRAVALKALELFDSPHNLDQLWVWSRFVWIFGERNTWAANSELESLLLEATNLLSLKSYYHQLEEKLAVTSWYCFKTRTGITRQQVITADAMQKCLHHIQSMFANYVARDKRWIDRDDFRAYVTHSNG